jgi:deazaflavin-dependent oxidoreductase (nitroreductase family)
MTEMDTEKLQNDPEALKTFNDNVVEEFRANDGKVGGPFAAADIMLLTTTGAKSGQPRLSPLAYFTVEGRILIVGSYGGAPKDPAWVANVRANPDVTVEARNETFEATATIAGGAERDRLWDEHVAQRPWFAEYPAQVGERVIPMVRLSRS